jgi:hypothetical protein
MSFGGVRIRQASAAGEIDTARGLFEEYAAALEIDLGYQGFVDELAGLPGCYAPPRGRLLVAWWAMRRPGVWHCGRWQKTCAR